MGRLMQFWVGGGPEQIALPPINIVVPPDPDPSTNWILIVGTIVVPLIVAAGGWYWKHRTARKR